MVGGASFRKRTYAALSVFATLTLAHCSKGTITEAYLDREIELSYSVDTLTTASSFEFLQAGSDRRVDVLIIVDDSGSMSGYVANVAANITNLFNVLRTNTMDYRVALTTTDPNPAVIGRFYGDPAHPTGSNYFSKDDYPNAPAELAGFQTPLFSIRDTVDGHGDERGLAVMKHVILNDPNSFFRAGAFKAVIIIADEDECSSGAGARSPRLNALTAGVPDAAVASFTYPITHPVVSVRSTNYDSVCNFSNDRPDEIRNAFDSASDTIIDLARFAVFALVLNPSVGAGESTATSLTSSGVDKFHTTTVRVFGGDRTVSTNGTNGGDVGDISGNSAYYSNFLTKIATRIVSLASQFEFLESVALPTPLSSVQLYMDGVARTYTTDFTVVDGSGVPNKLLLTPAFESSTAGKYLTIRWKNDTTLNRRFALPEVPDTSTLRVKLNGTALTSAEYTYDSSTREVVLDAGVVIVAADTLTISYFREPPDPDEESE